VATALATLSATCAYAGDSEATWGQSLFSGSGSIGSQIVNSQQTTQTNWSNLNGQVDTVGGDVAAMGAAAGNLVDITTMNNTFVNNSQIVGPSAVIGSNINLDANNVWGSVGIQNQVMCNGASVSTDPTWSATTSNQECHATDPASAINTNITNIAGDAAIQSSALGNSFEADSNAPNMPIHTNQLNASTVASTINANAFNVAGSVGMSSSAIGNTAQIIHYSTN
jgi:hypothetical protein